jgi:hypothetical protein
MNRTPTIERLADGPAMMGSITCSSSSDVRGWATMRHVPTGTTQASES